MTALVELDRVSVHFPQRQGAFGRRRVLRAVEQVSLAIADGETLGLVGESGSGKSTLGHVVAGLLKPTQGAMRFRGQALDRATRRTAQHAIQIVFQDPFGALDPRMPVSAIIAEPLTINRIGSPAERRARAAALVRDVGLPQDALNRYPHEFSGGQRQRIAIARALAVEPKLIICDEPVSALDVSIRSQILNLLRDLQERLGLSYIFVSHDLAVVKHIADRVAVMNLGNIVETAETSALFAAPRHPYSRALLSAIPVAKPQAKRTRMLLQGEMPSALNPPSGCRFHTRCPFAIERCLMEAPGLITDGNGHAAACHRTAELPSADGVVPSDGGFSPVLEKLVAAFSLSEEGPAENGVGIVGPSTTA